MEPINLEESHWQYSVQICFYKCVKCIPCLSTYSYNFFQFLQFPMVFHILCCFRLASHIYSFMCTNYVSIYNIYIYSLFFNSGWSVEQNVNKRQKLVNENSPLVCGVPQFVVAAGDRAVGNVYLQHLNMCFQYLSYIHRLWQLVHILYGFTF